MGLLASKGFLVLLVPQVRWELLVRRVLRVCKGFRVMLDLPGLRVRWELLGRRGLRGLPGLRGFKDLRGLRGLR